MKKDQVFGVLLYLNYDSNCNTVNTWHLYQGVSYRDKDIDLIVGCCREEKHKNIKNGPQCLVRFRLIILIRNLVAKFVIETSFTPETLPCIKIQDLLCCLYVPVGKGRCPHLPIIDWEWGEVWKLKLRSVTHNPHQLSLQERITSTQSLSSLNCALVLSN